MRTPLSWLRDFADFREDPADLAATLDDLGLVVEGIDRVGEGLGDVVVARVDEIAAIEGADRIRLVTVDAGAEPVEVVCGAFNFSVGDLVPLAPVGARLPGDFEITRRKMKGVTSNGMLCSGKELALDEDAEGLLVLSGVEGARPGLPIAEALGIERDVVFDITVEGNRPDAWSMAGVARDLAGRLRIPFMLPDPPAAPDAKVPVGDVASVVVEDPDLCPRFTSRVVVGVPAGPSPRWLARRLTLAGMRPVNHVVDVSNYVMLELGQPTHPYDLDRLPGAGLRVRRARPGELLTTLDGVERTLGIPGRGLGDTGEDCLICDAEGTPVGIGGVMGGASSEISDTTTRVLLEAAYFDPMTIARTSKRLGLRTEASARFERGCDPWGIDRATARFCELLGAPVAEGVLDVRGSLPEPLDLLVPLARVRTVLGTAFGGDEVSSLLEPIGFGCEPDGETVSVRVPTNRPDIRPAPHGVDDVIEEIGRTYGYSRLTRTQPSWPQPGRLNERQHERRHVRAVMCGLGASEAWTNSFLDDEDHARVGLSGEAVRVANPLASEESVLRRSVMPGLLRALAYNADRRQGEIRLFEVGAVFSHPDGNDPGGGRVVERAGAGGGSRAVLPGEREVLAAVFAAPGDDARTAAAAWATLAQALRLTGVRLVPPGDGPALSGLHPTRSARLVAPGQPDLGRVGEIDPAVLDAFGLVGRVGWLEVDLGALTGVGRVPEEAHPVSRFPSSDIDLALVVADSVAAADVATVLEIASGDLLESVHLFDVYRGAALEGRRSLAYRLRFCALDRTLTDEEVGHLRTGCIEAVSAQLGAELR